MDIKRTIPLIKKQFRNAIFKTNLTMIINAVRNIPQKKCFV